MEGFLNPEKILNEVQLKSDDTIADFGCGSGIFTIVLAKRAKDGIVYALDVQQAPLSAVKGRANSEKVENIKYIRCDLEKPNGSKLANQSVDFVLLANTLFQAEDKKSMMIEAKRVLKENGRLLVIDWNSDGSQKLVPNAVGIEEIKKTADELKFVIEKEFKAGQFHFGLLLKNV